MSTFLRLPEILAIILDFVVTGDEGTRDMIKKCSLVSRLWCSLSRPHIFRAIRITLTKDKIREWAARCKNSPYLAPFITDLTLKGRPMLERSYRSSEAWGVEDAEELGRELTHVRSLTLTRIIRISAGVDFASHLAILKHLLKHLGSVAGGLQSIRLEVIRAVQPVDLFTYLSSIPTTPSHLSLASTRALDFETDTHRDDGFNVKHPPGSHTHKAWPLRSLVLHHTELRRDVLSWLLSSAVNLAGLHSLVVAPSPLYSFGKMISPLSKSLFEELMVSVEASLRCLTLGSFDNDLIVLSASHLL
ncbi:hypothetical protein PM082_021230 [Marasmius tenuissimus]|nr:hypothetical protein PM082_021230 [Marasmius tenuissimus]